MIDKVAENYANCTKFSPYSKNECSNELENISKIFSFELNEANKRLSQYISPKDVLAAIRIAASQNSLVLIQPGASGYAWSDRTVPLVLVFSTNSMVKFRVRRGRCYRGNTQTPAIWKELKGFPRGNTEEKLKEWVLASDGGSISTAEALKIPEYQVSCQIETWLLR